MFNNERKGAERAKKNKTLVKRKMDGRDAASVFSIVSLRITPRNAESDFYSFSKFLREERKVPRDDRPRRTIVLNGS